MSKSKFYIFAFALVLFVSVLCGCSKYEPSVDITIPATEDEVSIEVSQNELELEIITSPQDEFSFQNLMDETQETPVSETELVNPTGTNSADLTEEQKIELPFVPVN